MIWMVRSGVGIRGPCCSYVAPFMCTISGCNFARQLHCVLHVQLTSHGGMVVLACMVLVTNISECEVSCDTLDLSRLVSW